MRHYLRGVAFALPMSAAVLNFGCSSGSTADGTPDASEMLDANKTADAGTPSSATFTEVYATIVATTCSTSQCHNSANAEMSGLDMRSKAIAYENLVGVVAAGYLCRALGDTRVVPGNPSESLLYLKVSEVVPPCGFQMPFNLDAGVSGAPLSQAQQMLIYDWIQGGARNN
jgi:hypothetical protein